MHFLDTVVCQAGDSRIDLHLGQMPIAWLGVWQTTVPKRSATRGARHRAVACAPGHSPNASGVCHTRSAQEADTYCSAGKYYTTSLHDDTEARASVTTIGVKPIRQVLQRLL